MSASRNATTKPVVDWHARATSHRPSPRPLGRTPGAGRPRTRTSTPAARATSTVGIQGAALVHDEDLVDEAGVALRAARRARGWRRASPSQSRAGITTETCRRALVGQQRAPGVWARAVVAPPSKPLADGQVVGQAATGAPVRARRGGSRARAPRAREAARRRPQGGVRRRRPPARGSSLQPAGVLGRRRRSRRSRSPKKNGCSAAGGSSPRTACKARRGGGGRGAPATRGQGCPAPPAASSSTRPPIARAPVGDPARALGQPARGDVNRVGVRRGDQAAPRGGATRRAARLLHPLPGARLRRQRPGPNPDRGLAPAAAHGGRTVGDDGRRRVAAAIEHDQDREGGGARRPPGRTSASRQALDAPGLVARRARPPTARSRGGSGPAAALIPGAPPARSARGRLLYPSASRSCVSTPTTDAVAAVPGGERAVRAPRPSRRTSSKPSPQAAYFSVRSPMVDQKPGTVFPRRSPTPLAVVRPATSPWASASPQCSTCTGCPARCVQGAAQSPAGEQAGGARVRPPRRRRSRRPRRAASPAASANDTSRGDARGQQDELSVDAPRRR